MSDRRDPPADVDLTMEEIDDLLVTLQSAFRRDPEAQRMLRRLDYPPSMIPTFTGRHINAWNEVFHELDQGIVEAPYRRLIEEALRIYARNRTLLGLATRHGLAGHRREDTGTTCQVIVRAASEAQRHHAASALAAAGLDPTLSWYSANEASFRVNTADHDLLALLLNASGLAPLWRIIPAEGQDSAVRSLRLEGPDPRRFVVSEAPTGPEPAVHADGPGTGTEPDPPRSITFLCHSSDDKDRVRELYRRLETDGFPCWFDEEALLGGQDWDLEIRKAMRASRFVLACLSASSVTRTGYLQRELRYALDLADQQPEGVIFLIPVRLEQCAVPDRLASRQHVDLFREGGYERLIRSLRAADTAGR